MSMQGRDNESESDPDPPDSFNSLSLDGILGISMSTGKGKSTFWQNEGGRVEYERANNGKKAEESHDLVHWPWSITDPMDSTQDSTQPCLFLLPQLLRFI